MPSIHHKAIDSYCTIRELRIIREVIKVIQKYKGKK
jgi:hypothetical protein